MFYQLQFLIEVTDFDQVKFILKFEFCFRHLETLHVQLCHEVRNGTKLSYQKVFNIYGQPDDPLKASIIQSE